MYPDAFLKVVSRSKSFQTEAVGFLVYGIIPPANKDMTFSFPIYFIFFSDFIDMTSNLVLNKRGENGHSLLLSDDSKCTFSFIAMLIIGLSHTIFIMVTEQRREKPSRA